MASETLRGLDESLLLQKLREHLEPYLAVVDLEHALLDRERQRQDLGQPIADPGRVGERELGGKVLLADTVDQEVEQVGEWLERSGQRGRRRGPRAPRGRGVARAPARVRRLRSLAGLLSGPSPPASYARSIVGGAPRAAPQRGPSECATPS